MTNLGLGGYVEADIKDKLLAGEEKDDANALEIAKAAGHSLLHSAIQQPMSALVQIGAAASGKDFEAPELIATPQHAEFGTGKWYAQTIGAGAGMVMPFLASEAVVCRIGKAASHMGGAKLASTLESTALGAKVMPTLNPIGHSAASGAFYGLVFTPSSDTEANFISDRLKNATVSGVTFGAQRAATIGITAGTQKAWSSGMEAARKGTTDLGTMSRLSSLESALTHPALKATNRITANALGGAVAGAVHANAHAYMFEGRAATGQETWESVATFVVTGGALDAAHIVGGKIAERNAGRRAQSAPEPTAAENQNRLPDTVEKSSGGSGGLTDVHKRLTEGAEHAREGVVKPSTPMVAEAATSLTSHIKQMLRLGPEKELSEYRATRDLHKLIEQVKSREHDIEGANASEVTRTLQAVDRLVTAEQLAVPLSRPERLAVAKQILFEAANPKSMPTGTRETSPVLAMEQSVSYWNPGRYAESVVSVLTTGKYKSPGTNPVEIDLSPHLMAKAPKEYRNALAPDAVSRQGLIAALKDGYQPGRDHTYAGQINELLGMNLLSQTNPNSKQFYLRSDAGAKMFEMDARSGRLRESEQPVFDVEPGHLMRIFDLKTGVHKPELALKKPIGSHFGIVDRTGNMKIIANDTVWAELGTQIDGKSLTLTGKANHNYMGSLELTNAQGLKVHADLLPTEHGFSKQVRIENTTDKAVTVTVAENFKPRVEDIFTGERGWVEPEPLPARRQQTEINPNNSVTLTYTQTEKPPQYKLDGGPQINYELQLAASSARDGQGTATRPEVSAKGAEYKITIGPGEAHQYQVDVRTAVNRPISELGDVVPFTTARTVAQQQFKDWIDGGTQVRLQGASASTIFSRAQGDIATLMIPTEHGPILAAGIPDFVTIFGRDSKTASQQTLAYNAKITEANLRADAALQGKIHDEYSAQLPGKMVHEVREGPLAKTLVQQPDGSYHSALPFARYYGSVDSTPMFLKLIGRYVDQTGNMQVVRDLYPNIQKALELMDFEVQRGGGYLRYGGRGNEALSNQGWKDSGISIKHANDQLAKAPIALAEPQGYLYEGWMQIAKVERLLAEQSPENAARHLKRAQELEAKAQDLSQRFQRDFWMPEKEFIALALDGTGKQADVVTSNPGHLLATGILSPENAKLVAERMVAPDMSSGYGIRTMASSELPYFANSYHNGPVWLHDFWYWADGAHKVIPEQAAKLSGEAVAAVHHFPDQRVPELWGGYSRSEHGIPIPYPRANSPQAWSGGAVLGLLASNLGLQPQAWANNFNGSLRIYKPMIPEGFGNVVEFNNYRVGDKVVSLRFTGNAQGSANVEVTSNPGNLPIEVVPHNKGE